MTRARAAQELTVVVVDVSPTMHADLPVIAQAVTELMHKKARSRSRAAARGFVRADALRRSPGAQVLFSKPGDQLVALQLSGSYGAHAPRRAC